MSPLPDSPGAHLEARLALYAQYAALVSDEVAAAWSGEPEQAWALTRQLADERQAIAERYDAMRADAARGDGSPDGFPGVLAGAMTELEHQAAVHRALRDRLDALQATGWTGASNLASLRALPAESIMPAAAKQAAAARDATEAGDDPSRFPELGGALVMARSDGVGGALGGRYPGVVAGADTADYVVGSGTTDAVASVRVDVRF
jgi:hypothetical protein